MRYYLIFIVFSTWYVSINAQSEDNSTTNSLVQNVTEEETTVASTTEYTNTDKITEHATSDQTTEQMNFDSTTKHTTFDQTTQQESFEQTTQYTTLEQTTEQKSFDQTTQQISLDQTTVMLDINSTTSVSTKGFVASYVEPPLHPLGYCIRSRLRCSKIRRCCKGPCGVIKMKCP
ncbi:unnamed protein product [Rotaria sp. Silwood1]|nr:unnamed protein product [Rotaria sp. Silwood1]CAF0745270.1 unnamed protein product [Rotaria sp. Silwood1]